MNPDTILQLLSGVITLVTLVVGRRASDYFRVGNRTARANLVAVLAKDILALVVLQKGVNTQNAEIIKIAIDRLVQALVGQGFKVETARDIATSAIAGAAAEQGLDLANTTL